MIKENLVRYATQPEDFLAETELINKFDFKNILLWMGGGCTALNLITSNENLNIDVFDPKDSQVDHFKAKLSALRRGDFDHLNLNHPDQDGLNQTGRYESLLRIFRRFFFEFITEHDAFSVQFFHAEPAERSEIFSQIKSHSCWNHSFRMFFSKPTLEAVLGGEWAEDSCAYVRQNVEELLLREDVNENWLIKHLFLGEYLDEAKPPYFDKTGWTGEEIGIHHKVLTDFQNLENYDFIGLSNYLDFLNAAKQQEVLNHLKSNMRKGSVLLLRSIRDKNVLWETLDSEFHLDRTWGDDLLKKDKSFLFSHMLIATKE